MKHKFQSFEQLLRDRKRNYFVNRDTEIKSFEHMIENDNPDYHIIQLQGIGGIGKSSILDKFKGYCQEKSIPWLYFDMAKLRTSEDYVLEFGLQAQTYIYDQGFTEFRRFFEKLSNLSQRTGSGNFSSEEESFLKNLDTLGADIICRTIENYTSSLGKSCFVILLDTYETTNEDLDNWLFNSIIQNLPVQTRVVIAGRVQLRNHWNRYRMFMKTSQVVGLSEVDITKYLDKRGVPTDITAELFSITDGHPLCLALTIDIAGKNLKEEVTDKSFKQSETRFVVIDTLLETIFNHIENDRLKAIIEGCAIFRTFDEKMLEYLLLNSEYLSNIHLAFYEKPANKNSLKKKQIDALLNRLQKLEVQKAKMGILVPVHIEIEIEEIKKNIGITELDKNETEGRLSARSVEVIARHAIHQLRVLSFTILREEKYSLHDLVREYLIEHMRNTKKLVYEELHRIALGWYLLQVNSGSTVSERKKIILEVLHHKLALDEDKGIEYFASIYMDYALNRFSTKFERALVNELKSVHLAQQKSKDWLEYTSNRPVLQAGKWTYQAVEHEKMLNRLKLTPQVKLWIFFDLGSFYRSSGHVEQAEKRLHQCVSLARQLGDKRALWHGTFELAKIFRTMNRWDEAKTYYQKALRSAQEMNDFVREGRSLLHIGAINNFFSNWDDAKQDYLKAIPLLQNAENDFAMARVRFNLGWSHTMLGEWEQAELCFEQALSISQDLGADHSMISIWLGIAQLRLMQEDYEVAKENLERSLSISIKLNYSVYLTKIYIMLGKLYLVNSLHDIAEQNFGKALEVAKEQKASVDRDVAFAFHLIATSRQHTNDEESTMVHYSKIAAQLSKVPSLFDVLEAKMIALSHDIPSDDRLAELFILRKLSAEANYNYLTSYLNLLLVQTYSQENAIGENVLLDCISSALRTAFNFNSEFFMIICKKINEVIQISHPMVKIQLLQTINKHWPFDLPEGKINRHFITKGRHIILSSGV